MDGDDGQTVRVPWWVSPSPFYNPPPRACNHRITFALAFVAGDRYHAFVNDR